MRESGAEHSLSLAWTCHAFMTRRLRNASSTRRYAALPWPVTVRRGFAERIGIYSRTGHLTCRGALEERQLKT